MLYIKIRGIWMVDYDLENKDVDIIKLKANVLTDNKLFNELIAGLKSKDNTLRQNCFKVLEKISEENPEFLYSSWDQFSTMVVSKNNFHKYIAIYLLANLTAVDAENKFEKIFDDYYGILGGDKTMAASHVALNSSKIALNKPELQDKIVDILLDIDSIYQGKQKELIKAYSIQSLEEIYPQIKDKDRVKQFVRAQLESPSPKTRNSAADFFERHS